MASITRPNFQELLKDIFPYTSAQAITDVILMVEEQNPYDTFEGKVENMVNLLSGDGAQGPMPEIATVNNRSSSSVYSDDPDLDPEEDIDDLPQNGYDKLKVDPLTVWEQLKLTLPNADPDFLKIAAHRLVQHPQQVMDDFVQNAIEKNDYPTMQDYLKNKKENDEILLYTEFNIERYLEEVPNPVETFSDPKRKLLLNENSEESEIQYSIKFLYNHYRFIRKIYIDQLFKWKRRNLVQICDRLDRMNKSMRRPRPMEDLGPIKNIPLLQLITYLKHRKQIKRFIKMKDEDYRIAKEEARKYNLLETCQCCFDQELIPEECFFCLKGCIFCKDCIKLGTENVIGTGDLKFPCFASCDSEFSLQTLQMVLPKKIFERLAQKIASEEIKKANVEGLETCPFCDFAMVLPDSDKIFKCENEDCLIESCRECRHKSHIPLRCSEIEYDEDVRRRTYIENKMTEALTRTCYNCQKTFIKTTGCNKMTCTCGAKMCYLCGEAVKDYSHFRSGKCALFINDTELNLNRILTNARQAKQDLGNVQIKFDPTIGIQDYYAS